MGVNFRLADGATGSLNRRTAKVKLVLPFSHGRQKFWCHPATICTAHYLVVPPHPGLKVALEWPYL